MPKQKTHSEIEDKFKIYDGRAGDGLTDDLHELFHENIASGKIFEDTIQNFTHRMDMKTLLKFFDQFESYSMIDFVVDYNLDKTKVDAWIKEYVKFKTIVTRSNNQYVDQNTTAEQIILYYYLVRLGIVDLDRMQELFPGDITQSSIIAFLLSKDESNVRKKLREIISYNNGIPKHTKRNFKKIAELAKMSKCKELIKMVEEDVAKLKED